MFIELYRVACREKQFTVLCRGCGEKRFTILCRGACRVYDTGQGSG